MKWLFLIGATAFAAACAPEVVIAPDEPDPDPPLGPTCQEAVDAVDWAPCEDARFPVAANVSFARYCENQVAAPSCGDAAKAYYGCIASKPRTCEKVENDATSSVSFGPVIPDCDGMFDAWSACVAQCGSYSTCVDEAVSECTCTAPSPHQGEGCCWYPGCPEDGSIPNCYSLCEVCTL